MPWKEVRVRDLTELFTGFEGLDGIRPAVIPYCFRGQARDDWPLRDSLTRLCDDANIVTSPIEAEHYAYRRFLSQAHLLLDPSSLPAEKSLLTWWSLMQHYGCPTRLLDWTMSPYVATYFAVSSDMDHDGAVYAFNAHNVSSSDQRPKARMARKTLEESKDHWDLFWGEEPVNFMHVFTLKREHMRSIAQQGVFTVCGVLRTDHGDLIDESLAFAPPDSLIKFQIPKDLKSDALRHLMRMNITANSLFPGLDGLGKSIREFLVLDLPYCDIF